MFLVNSRLGSFTAPSVGSSKNHHQKDPFSLSYGARLPSSLTRFLSRALVCSTIQPVSVLVRSSALLARSFSWRHGISQSASPEGFTSHRISELFRWIYLPRPPTGLDHHFQSVADLASCVTPSLKHRIASTGIFSLLPITYAFRPRLRGRLTLGGRTFPRKP